MSPRTLTEVEVEFQILTAKGICVRASEGGSDIWIPRATCQWEGEPERGQIFVLTLPEALAIDKGLV